MNTNNKFDYKKVTEDFLEQVKQHELIYQRKQKLDILFPDEDSSENEIFYKY